MVAGGDGVGGLVEAVVLLGGAQKYLDMNAGWPTNLWRPASIRWRVASTRAQALKMLAPWSWRSRTSLTGRQGARRVDWAAGAAFGGPWVG